MTASQIHDRLITLLTPVLADVHLELVDVIVASLGTAQASVQVLVDHDAQHPLGGRIDLDGVSAATRIIDAAIEADDPIDSAFELEVSSPGLERPLRTPAHFVRFVGTVVSVKTLVGSDGERRVEGRLDAAEPISSGSITVDGKQISYDSIDRARTVFVWGPQPKPGKGGTKPGATKAKAVPGNAPAGKAAPDKQTLASAGVDHDEE